MKKLITNKEYHQTEAIGSTLLKQIALKSLLHAKTQEFSQTPAMVLGSAAHAAILEPETFRNEYATALNDEGFLKTSDDLKKELKSLGLKVSGSKSELAQRLIDHDKMYQNAIFDLVAERFRKENEGKTILTQEQSEAVREIKSAVLSHNIAKGMLTGGESEYSYFAEILGVTCKCRPDYYLPIEGCLVDLKTCSDASADGFTRACINLGYAIQAAFYLDVFNAANGTTIQEFYFVAVETTKPYAVNTFKMGEVELNLGRRQYKKALEQLIKYNANPDPVKFGYPEQVNEIQFPLWALEKMEA